MYSISLHFVFLSFSHRFQTVRKHRIIGFCPLLDRRAGVLFRQELLDDEGCDDIGNDTGALLQKVRVFEDGYDFLGAFRKCGITQYRKADK